MLVTTRRRRLQEESLLQGSASASAREVPPRGFSARATLPRAPLAPASQAVPLNPIGPATSSPVVCGGLAFAVLTRSMRSLALSLRLHGLHGTVPYGPKLPRPSYAMQSSHNSPCLTPRRPRPMPSPTRFEGPSPRVGHRIRFRLREHPRGSRCCEPRGATLPDRTLPNRLHRHAPLQTSDNCPGPASRRKPRGPSP